MAYQLETPVVSSFILTEIDPSGETQVSFRQATVKQCVVRDQQVFGGQRRTFLKDGVAVEKAVSDLERARIECYLTMCACNILAMAEGEKKPTDLFRFKNGELAMTEDEFTAAFSKLPPTVGFLLHMRCLDANPDWDYRAGPKN